MTFLVIALVALAVATYAVWPALTGIPRERSVLARVRALCTVDETLVRAEETFAEAQATFGEVREVVAELATVLRRLDHSLTRLDHTVTNAGEAMGSIDELAERALPLLATLEKVVTPMAAAGRAARLVRRSGAPPATGEVLDEETGAAYGLVDFSVDETQVISPVS